MKRFSSGTKFVLFIVILLLFIVGYQFQQQVVIMKQPPSEKWGKEVYISDGKITNNMQLAKYGKNYVALHNDDFKLKVLLLDSLGNVVKDKVLLAENMNMVFDFSLNTRDNYIYVNAIMEDEGIACSNTFKLDNNLEIIECTKTPLPGIRGFSYIDQDLFLTSYFPGWGQTGESKINFHDWNLNTIKSVKFTEPVEDAVGIKIHNGCAVVYHDKENFYYFTYDVGKTSKPKAFYKYIKGGSFSIENFVLSSDNNNLYFMYDEILKGSYKDTRFIQVNLIDGTVKDFEFKNFRTINAKGVHSEDGARFIYTEPYNDQVVDVLIKDGKIIEKNYISRLAPLNINSYVCDDMAIFAKFEKTDFYNVYVSSTEENYKSKNNILRNIDKKMALRTEMKGLTKVITYFFTLGAICLLPLLAIASIYSLISFRLVRKNKIKSYLAFSGIGLIFKTFMFYKHFYVGNLICFGIFRNCILGIIGSVIIGLSVYGYYFYKYKKDSTGIFVVRFLPPSVIDVLITLILFVPFTV